MQNFSRRNLIALALTLATPFSIMASGSLRLEDLCTKLSFGNVILASFTAKKRSPGYTSILKALDGLSFGEITVCFGKQLLPLLKLWCLGDIKR